MPQFGGASEKCSVCSKTVYLAEKIVVEDKEDKKTFHKTCLKCSHCKATLSLGNYASMNGVMYCKPHFKQLFATKGNYDEGFGKEKLTSKWSPNPTPGGGAAASGSFVPVDKTDDNPKEKKETPSAIAAKFQSATEKCDHCTKAVYATEKIVIEEKEGKKVFHKQCLRCSHCQVILTLGNYASMNGITYCKPHFKQLFATKGNYDEGFGKEKHTTKWDPQAGSSPGTFVPVEKVDVPKENKNAASTDVASRFKNISAADKCAVCGKTVYLTERVVVEDKDDKKLLHKACLRCTHCQVVLSLGSYASMNGVMYCKPHFKQLFATKGNYDEGFGKEKHSAKWVEQDEKKEGDEQAHEAPHHEHEQERREREPEHDHSRHEQEQEREREREREREQEQERAREREREQEQEREREREREQEQEREREREHHEDEHKHHEHEHEHKEHDHDQEHKHHEHEHEHESEHHEKEHGHDHDHEHNREHEESHHNQEGEPTDE